MAISKAKDPSVMMFPSDFLLLLALLREVVDRAHDGHGAQRARFAKKVNKPPLGVNVINFELNGFNGSLGVPQTQKRHDALVALNMRKTCIKYKI
jgi:hypothetical protein